MTTKDLDRSERLRAYLDAMTAGLGRTERLCALRNYTQALLLPGKRKSVQPLAMRIAPTEEEAEAYRQRMQQAVAVARWDEKTIYRRICEKFVASVPDVDALVIDDTGFPKKGKLSPCVQRQYSGTLGRRDNCQVAVSLHLASDIAGACIGMQLFLPESWASDGQRMRKAQLPEGLEHRPKWKIALEMLDERRDWVQDKTVLADSGYGESYQFRRKLESRGLSYVVGVSSKTAVWAGGRLPTPPEERSNTGRGPTPTRWSRDILPESVLELAEMAEEEMWEEYEWTNGQGASRRGSFLALRVRHAYRASAGAPPGQPQWLLIQRYDDGDRWKFWLSNLPEETDVGRLVYLAKLRWRIERDYQEMKDELGLDHYEGRTWPGFHHHCALVAAAHAFLALERALSPPERSDRPALPL